jgi:hypothetical protein
MGAPVVWFEVAGRNLDTLSKFYGELFGWKVNTDNPIGYGLVDTAAEGGIPGGIFTPGEDVEYVSFYVAVHDLDESLKQAEKLGAKVVQPPTPIPEGPTIAMVNDPEGHRIGILQEPS